MTPFALLASLAGLSHREAAEFLNVRVDTAKSWSAGRRACPAYALDELKALIARQERAAREPDAIELGYPADDAEARALGWTCVGAWRAMAARLLAVEPRARLVPRGSTPATAAAGDARESRDYGSTAEPRRR